MFTGGEPMQQLNRKLVEEIKAEGFAAALETNGTIPVNLPLDWITVSPKAQTQLKQKSGNELKFVYPQEKEPAVYAELDFSYFFLLPKETASAEETLANIKAAAEYCRQNPRWRMTGQYHKLWGLP